MITDERNRIRMNTMNEKESRRKKRGRRLKGKEWIIKILEKIETWSKQSLRTMVKTSRREKRGKYCNHFLSKLIFNLRTEARFTLCTVHTFPLIKYVRACNYL